MMVMVKLLKVTPVHWIKVDGIWAKMSNTIYLHKCFIQCSDDDDEEYHTASPAIMCLKVGKENIKVTTLYEQSEEGEAAEEEDEGSFFSLSL